MGSILKDVTGKYIYQKMMSLANKVMKKDISQLRKYLYIILKIKDKKLPLRQNMINMVITFQCMTL